MAAYSRYQPDGYFSYLQTWSAADAGGADFRFDCLYLIAHIFVALAAGGSGAYSATKGAISSLVRCMAIDYAKFGIRVNAVVPGATETGLMWNNVPAEALKACGRNYAARSPWAPGESGGSGASGCLASFRGERLHDGFACGLRRRNSGQVVDQRLMRSMMQPPSV